MLARTAPRLTLDTTVASPVRPARLIQVAVEHRGVGAETLRVAAHADRLPDTTDVRRPARDVGHRPSPATAPRDARYAERAAPEARAAGGSCPPRTTTQIVCATNARCVCPLAGSVTDGERATMNDISRQASRLATVLAWVFVLLALAGMVMVMLLG